MSDSRLPDAIIVKVCSSRSDSRSCGLSLTGAVRLSTSICAISGVTYLRPCAAVVVGQRAQQRAQLAVVTRLADHLDVGCVGQRVADAPPDQRVVVAQDHPNHRSRSTGQRADTDAALRARSLRENPPVAPG